MERERATKFVHELLELLVKQKGSDLFITAGFPPAIKVDGKIAPVSKTTAHAAAHDRARAQRDERQAGGGVRRQQGMQLRHRAAWRRPLPLQRVRPAGSHRHGDADHHHGHPEIRGPGAAAGAEGRDHVQARHHDVRRRDGRGQVDVDGVAARLPQREQLRPHHHDRGPDRIRPRSPQLHHHAARDRRRHRGLDGRAEELDAPGT